MVYLVPTPLAIGPAALWFRQTTRTYGKQVDVLPSKNQAMCKLNHC